VGDDDKWDRLTTEGCFRCSPFVKRIPKGSKDNDDFLAYSPALIRCAGTSWWNYRDQLTEAMGIDFDCDHSNAQGLEGIERIDALAVKLPYVLNVSSKGGLGRHWTVFVEPMTAPTRRHHLANCAAILSQVSKELDTDLKKLCCASGCILYIYHWRPAPNGLKLIKGVQL